jgi:hypothetical protein
VKAVLAIALHVGCQRDGRSSEPPSRSDEATIVSPVARPTSPGDRVDVQGIVVTFLDGGMIEVRGRDRWGNALDTTYESIEFLRQALPVLERSVSEEQAAGLRALIAGP